MKRNRLKQVSKKKRQVMRDRARVRKTLVQERGPQCELRFVYACRGIAEGMHEKLKQSALPWRVGDYELGRVVFLACNVCNAAIESEPKRAQDAGFSESRFSADVWTRPDEAEDKTDDAVCIPC